MARTVKFNYVLMKNRKKDLAHALPYETRSEKGVLQKCGTTLCGIPIGGGDTVLLNETKLMGSPVCNNCVRIAREYILKYLDIFGKIPGVNLKLANKK
ncbi:MAG: hypothetical protein WC511_01635 [Candidatus Pacearchaeota archaeon]